VAKEEVEQQLPAFARANQNMAVAAALLDEVYQWLISILDAAAV
jgi:hypothetical protein